MHDPTTDRLWNNAHCILHAIQTTWPFGIEIDTKRDRENKK
jgi:hypothetical protein